MSKPPKTKEILADWIIKNAHSCPFADDAGFDFNAECVGLREPGCVECLLKHADKIIPNPTPVDNFGNDLSGLKPGDYVLYRNGSRFELGRIKHIDFDERTAWIWYSTGDTASRTHFCDMVRLNNQHVCHGSGLGGDMAAAMFSGDK